MRVADYAMNYLNSSGVTHVFTIAGGGAMFLNDALAAHPDLRYICTHHEQAAAIAAEAYAKTSGRVGAAVVTSGPGSTNAITGLLGAWQDSIPCVFLSSQAKRSQMSHFLERPGLRQFGVQELNIVPVVRSLTKYAAVVERPEDIHQQMEHALYLATTGRPGPVWLDIPSDVAGASIDGLSLAGSRLDAVTAASPQPDAEDVALTWRLIEKAKRPLLIAGGGIRLSGGARAFRELVEVLGVPVVATEMGLDLLPHDHGWYLGHGGTKGQRAANLAIQHADLLVCIGSRLAVPFIGHSYGSFGPLATKVVVDIDRQEHEKPTIKIDRFVHSDARLFIEALKNHCLGAKRSPSTAWALKCEGLKRDYPACPQGAAKRDGPVNMYYAIDRISEHSQSGDIFTIDAGGTAYVACQAIRLREGQRLIVPGCTLTMGYNLPAVVGIWAASPQSRVICITGDGSLQLNIHELQTIVHHNIPAKIFVTNNNGYLAIRTTQKQLFDGRYIGEGPRSGVSFPDLAKIASAYGLASWRVTEGAILDDVIRQVLDHPGPAVCEILSPEWQDITSVSSSKLQDGTMVSRDFDDMYPFLPAEELERVRADLLS